jgi:hypothetical protein
VINWLYLSLQNDLASLLQMIVARLIKWMLVAGKEIKLGVMATKKPGKNYGQKGRARKEFTPNSIFDNIIKARLNPETDVPYP